MFSSWFGSTSPASPTPSSSSSTPPPPSSAQATTPPPPPVSALDRPQRTFKQEFELQNKLYPTEEDVPSCRELFDQKMRCLMSFKEQARSIYRSGTIDTCDRPSDDFTFCWSTMSKLEGEGRREAWVRRRAEWWTGRRLGESSEDVWDVRGEDKLVGFPPKLVDVDEMAEDMSLPRPTNRGA